MAFYYSDDPAWDAERYAADQDREMERRPKCSDCGDPIQYARIDTPYWQEHFLSFGRMVR